MPVDLKALEKDLIQRERILLSLASPINPFQTVQQDSNLIAGVDTYQNWLNSRGTQILHVYGTDSVSEISEQIYYALDNVFDNNDEVRHLVLYFSFDRWDRRYNSVKNMLSTFIAQIICHHTKDMSEALKRWFERLNQFRSWTDVDTIHWFDAFRGINQLHNVSCVINYIDECTEASQKALLAYFLEYARGSERTWKIAVTSRRARSPISELAEFPSIDLNVATSEDVPAQTRIADKVSTSLIYPRPDLRLQSDAFQERDLHTLESTLDWVLRSIQDQDSVRRLLAWLIRSVRPLTIWEMAIVMSIGSDLDNADDACPGLAALPELMLNWERWFAGIIEFRQNEVTIRHPRLKDLLRTTRLTEGRQCLWHEIQATADFDITRLCLEYISRPSVQRIMEQSYRAPKSESIEVSACQNRLNLCSYAAQTWPYHYSQVPSELNPSGLLSKYMRSAVGTSWFKYYWALSNAVTRPRRYLESLYPVFAGLGVSYQTRSRSEDGLPHVDLAMGLIEAARNGRANTVKSLLKKGSYLQNELLDALVAAGSSGKEQVMFDIINHIAATASDDSVVWPPVLLYRAAALSLDRFVGRLLELGCPPEPGGPLEGIYSIWPLLYAASYGSISTIRVLLKYKADPTRRDSRGRSLLHSSANRPDANIAKLLVEEGRAELEAKNKSGLTALYYACVFGHPETAKALLKMSADPNSRAPDASTSLRWTPLTAAAFHGYTECVRALLDNGATPNIEGPRGFDTPLRYAALSGNLDVCRLLLENGADPNHTLLQPPILIRIVNFKGTLSISKKVEMITLLVQYGASVDAKDNNDGTAIYRAAEDGNYPLTKCLVDHNADVNLPHHNGWTPLHAAADLYREDLIDLLVQGGAEVDCKTSTGAIPLTLARERDSVVRLLLRKGADINQCNYQGLTPLMYAAANGYIPVAKTLLEHNAAPDLEIDRVLSQWSGYTALSFAAAFGKPETIRPLVEAGADLKHETEEGLSPIHLAKAPETLRSLLEFRRMIDIDQTASRGQTALHRGIGLSRSLETIKLLVNGGANLNAQDKYRDTPLSIAARENAEEIVSILLKQDGIDVNLGSPAAGAALHWACARGNVDTVKLLVEHDADVNCCVPGIPGHPLQSVFWGHWAERDDSDLVSRQEILEYLVAKGADVRACGGALGSPISSAAFSGTVENISFLLNRGASVDVRDSVGRMPVHYAACQSVNNLKTIQNSGGDIMARDTIQRIPLHWATQHGLVDVVEHLLRAQQPGTVDDVDIDGWTPLCWALRGTDNYVSQTATAQGKTSQMKVIRLLLDRGADPSVRCRIGAQEWSPSQIALYNGAKPEILELLKDSHREIDVPQQRNKQAHRHAAYCDSCFGVSSSKLLLSLSLLRYRLFGGNNLFDISTDRTRPPI